VTAGLAFLERQATQRGVPTYTAESPVVFEATGTDDRGWRAPHVCVTANCAALLPALLDVLTREQMADGCWRPHWWRSPAYATALAAEALAAGGRREAVKAAVGWAAAAADTVTGAFETASLARVLALGGEAERASARKLLAGLAGSQAQDGGWASNAVMLVPAPQKAAASAGDRAVADDRRIFTTACVLTAIGSLRTRGEALE
jgi:hypothetical protein